MTAPDAPAAAPRGLLPALLLGVFMAALDTSIVAPAIPAVRAQFGVDHGQVALVTIVFVLCSLAATAPMAALGDRHGRRPVYLGCIALFAAGSLVAALAPNFGVLLAGRAIQGVGGGGILPTAGAAIGDAYTGRERSRALALIGAIYGMAFVLGPPLAAALMVAAGWHWIFVVNLPVAATVLALARRALPRRARDANARAGAAPRLDRLGIVVLFALLGALVLGLTRAVDDVVGARLWPAWLVLAAVLLPVLVRVERRATQPLVPPALFANARLARAYALQLGAGFGMGGVIFLASIATQAHGVAHDHAGFTLLPLVVASMVGSMATGRLLPRTGPRPLLAAGFVLAASGYGATAVTAWGLAGFFVAGVAVGLGIGVLVGGALRGIAIDEAPPALRGAAQGLINISTSIGTLLAVAAVGALADAGDGGPAALARGYVVVAAVMAAMALATRGLRGGTVAADGADIGRVSPGRPRR